MAHNTVVEADRNAPAVTQALAEFVANHPSRGWSDAVEHEAHRTFFNWLGCAIGAANHPAMLAALAAVREFDPPSQAAVLGRSDRVDMGGAALLNGISSHIFDYDDTHLRTIIHPAGPVAPALLALAEKTGASGRELIDALVLGVDVSCRIGNMIYPEHYDRGWHITGSTGMFGAAAGCARLLKLDARATQMALGIAASQPVGLREQFGTMTKPFHPGAAARAGLTSAMLARHGFTASPRAIEAPRGFAQVASTKFDWSQITDALGKRFEISTNTYKPFACGIVIHPSIDACVQFRDNHGIQPDDVARIELQVHSLVLELTGNTAPRNGLEAKFSVYHASAAGMMFGAAGEAQFADDIVNRPDVIALREKIVASANDQIDEASVDATLFCKDGRKIRLFVERAIGSVEKPMTDVDLEDKFSSLVVPVLGASNASELKSRWRLLGEAPDVRQLVASATLSSF